MDLFEAWKDSLEIVRPKNFKLFLLVTLNSIVQTYKILITRFWWLFGLFCIMVFSFFYMMMQGKTLSSPVLMTAMAIGFLFALLLLFITMLAARPSTLKKNISYFLSYKKHFLYFVICLAPLFGALFALVLLGAMNPLLSLWSKFGLSSKAPFTFQFLFLLFKIGSSSASVSLQLKLDQPWLWVWILFFVDAKPTFINLFMAFWRTLKMFVYNAPFWLFGYFLPVWVFNYTLNFLLRSIVVRYHYLSAWAVNIIWMLLFVVPICYVTNFYVKKIHDQFNLYYGKKY